MLTVILMLAGGALAHAQVEVWEGNDFPENVNADWDHDVFCTPVRTLESGRMAVAVELGECGPPPGGDSDYYFMPIDELTGVDFFLEFSVMTNGPRTELIGQSPAAIAASSFGPIGYSIAVSEDQIRYIEDATLVELFIDIGQGAPHVFRIETVPGQQTTWIDTEIVYQNVPPGDYPMDLPFISWQTRAYNNEHTSWWDYIRFGRIPDDASGDFNSDGAVDDFDLFYIDECITRSAAGEPAEPSCTWADMNGDDTADCADWQIIRDGFWSGPGQPPPLAACGAGVPAASQWGLVVMGLVTLVIGSVVYRRRAERYA